MDDSLALYILTLFSLLGLGWVAEHLLSSPSFDEFVRKVAADERLPQGLRDLLKAHEGVSEDLTCAVCWENCLLPVRVNCPNGCRLLYCLACARKDIEHGHSRGVQCPVCREGSRGEGARSYTHLPLLWSPLPTTVCLCPYGCGYKVGDGGLESALRMYLHVSQTCPRMPVTLPCGKILDRSESEAHASVCDECSGRTCGSCGHPVATRFAAHKASPFCWAHQGPDSIGEALLESIADVARNVLLYLPYTWRRSM